MPRDIQGARAVERWPGMKRMMDIKAIARRSIFMVRLDIMGDHRALPEIRGG